MYSWPDAYAKAQASDRILRERLDRLGLRFDAIRTEFGGVNACHGPLAGDPRRYRRSDPARGRASQDRSAVERFTKEIAPLALNGPPTVTGLGSGRPKVEEIVAYWPALIPKAEAYARNLGAGDIMARVQLVRIAHARSGDKGDTANVGLIALEPTSIRCCTRSDGRARQETFHRNLSGRGGTLRASESGRVEFPAARKPGWRRHVVAQGRCAGQNLQRRAAPHGDRRPR